MGSLHQPARDRLVMDPENSADRSHPHPIEIEWTGLLLESGIFASSYCLKDPSAGWAALANQVRMSAVRTLHGSFSKSRRILHLSERCKCANPEKQGLPQGNLEDKNSTVPAKRLDFKDYLMDKNRVTRNAFAHWLRLNEAHPRSFGFLLGTVHRKIERRPDILESVIFDGEARQLKGQQLVGFCISEIQTRIPA